MEFIQINQAYATLTWLGHMLLASLATANILLHKRDPKAASGWLGVVWLSPYLGAMLYWMLGINRIKRKGALIHKSQLISHPDYQEFLKNSQPYSSVKRKKLNEGLSRITQSPLLSAKFIELFDNGHDCYKRMLKDMSEAETSIYLQTYIFDTGKIADQVVETLKKAVARGVEVRVLIDAIGSRYSFPSVLKQLKRAGIPHCRFLPNVYPWHFSFLNLRNHRKILLIDQQVAYTGGMNIRDLHDQLLSTHRYARDLHFRLEGAVVAQLFHVFATDWFFAAKKKWPLTRTALPKFEQEPNYPACRVISDGPDFDFEKIRWVMLTAIHSAKHRILIHTPYFLPDFGVQSALAVAAYRGLNVEILVPKKGNIPLVNWAMMPQFRHLIKAGCRVHLAPAPFDHSKSMVVDDDWCLIGSANWDPRSLRLNFEVNLEVYDEKLSLQLSEIFFERSRHAELLSLEKLEDQSFLEQIRNNAARLLTPYL